jgi:hypothetical protein
VADFATRTDVQIEYGSSLPGTTERTDSLLQIASARLRILLPTLQTVIDDGDEDLAIMARDVVVQAVIRRLPLGSEDQGVQSVTQTAGPWQHTVRYTEDRSGTFPDDDLNLLRGALSRTVEPLQTAAGTIKLGRPDWTLG